MKNCVERVAISLLALTLFAAGADAQLNPTVKVMSAPVTPVPAECVDGVAQQAQPRIEVAQVPEASKRKATVAPPSASLRGLLQDVQNAADRGDRAAFRDALTRTKGRLTTYPTGGERTAATEVVGICDDLDRIWTYQIETSTGAFFDASAAPAEIMRGYPGYERAIADQALIDARGHRFYPTVETREFLLRETAQRLSRLGVSVPPRAARVPRILPRTRQAAAKPAAATTKQVAAARNPAAEIKPAEPRHAGAKPVRRAKAHVVPKTPERKQTTARTEIAGADPKKPVAVAQAEASKTVGPRSEPKVARPVEAAKAAVPSTSTHETKAAEAPGTAALPASSSAAPSPMALPSGASSPGTASSFPLAGSPTATDTTASAAVSAMATATSTTETTASAASTDTTATVAREHQQTKSVILPIILIVVGVGVLIVLFRASS